MGKQFWDYLNDEDAEKVRSINQEIKQLKEATPITFKGAVAFIDVLGWKGLWRDDKNALNKITAIIKNIEVGKNFLIKALIKKYKVEKPNLFKENEDCFIKAIGVSDTIAIFVEDKCSQGISFCYALLSQVVHEAAEEKIFLRGAISYGDFLFLNNTDFFIGEAVDEVAEWYDSCNWTGIILTPKASNMWNTLECIMKAIDPRGKDNRFIRYNGIPFKESILNRYDKKELDRLYVLNFIHNSDLFKLKDSTEEMLRILVKENKSQYILDKYLNSLKFIKYIEENSLRS